MYTRNWLQSRFLRLGLLAALGLAIDLAPVSAQTQTLSPSLGSSNTGSGGNVGSGNTGGNRTAGSNTTGGRTGTGGTGAVVTPLKTNPFYTYGGGPLSAGYGPNNTLQPNNNLSNNSASTTGVSNFTLMQALTKTLGSAAWGAPIYTQTTTSATGTNLANVGGTNLTAGRNSTVPGFSTYGIRRAPAYATVVTEELKPEKFSSLVPPPPQMLMLLRGAIDRSSALKSAKDIQVFLDGGVVVLQGNVVSDRERRLAEALVRLTPGIHDVRNEIVAPKR